MTSRSDRIAFSSPPGAAPAPACVPIAGVHPGGCTAVMKGGSWTYPRMVAPFRYALRFGDFVALSPVAYGAFSPSRSATRWLVDLLGAHLGLKRSCIISALHWAAGPRRRWRGG